MSKYLLFFQNNNKSNLIDSLPTRNLISTHTIANNDQFYSRIDIGRNDIYFMSSRNIASLKELENSNSQIIHYNEESYLIIVVIAKLVYILNCYRFHFAVPHKVAS